MQNLIRYMAVILLMLVSIKPVLAQYDNVYCAADAALVKVQGDNRVEHTLTGATLILPASTNELNINLRIPDYVFAGTFVNDSGFVNKNYLLQVKLKIDPLLVQENLTSTKTLQSVGYITLNNVTKEMLLEYMPLMSGTEENDYDMFLRIKFKASDFNLDVRESNAEFIVTINNAPLNKVTL